MTDALEKCNLQVRNANSNFRKNELMRLFESIPDSLQIQPRIGKVGRYYLASLEMSSMTSTHLKQSGLDRTLRLHFTLERTIWNLSIHNGYLLLRKAVKFICERYVKEIYNVEKVAWKNLIDFEGRICCWGYKRRRMMPFHAHSVLRQCETTDSPKITGL